MLSTARIILRLIPPNNRINAAGYAYDSTGNLTDAPFYRYTYDAENRMVAADSVNGTQTSRLGDYFYDGDGHRVKKVTRVETTIFVYDAMGQLVAEYSNQTSTVGATNYLTSDNLGSTRIVTAQDQSARSRHDYLPYGEESFVGRTGQGYGVNNNLRQKFAQYERDDEISLDFARARYYNPVQGRFTLADPWIASADTLDPQGWNRYSYTLNNPLRFTDPSGLVTQDPKTKEPYVDKDGLLRNPDGSRYKLPTEHVNNGPTDDSTLRFDAALGFLTGNRRRVPRSQEPSAGIGVSIGLPAHRPGAPTFRGVNFGLSAGIVGGTVSVKRDKFGNWYLSGGPSFGLSLPVHGSFILGGDTWSKGQAVTDERSVRNTLSGPSAGVTFTGFVGGMSGSWNTTPLGFFTTPIPTGANGTVSAQVGPPEASYSPQLTLRIPQFKW